jgi:hypothetical protein
MMEFGMMIKETRQGNVQRGCENTQTYCSRCDTTVNLICMLFTVYRVKLHSIIPISSWSAVIGSILTVLVVASAGLVSAAMAAAMAAAGVDAVLEPPDESAAVFFGGDPTPVPLLFSEVDIVSITMEAV